MLKLKIPPELATRIHDALLRNGVAECGGILMAEHTGPNEFTVRDLTVHRRGGFANFVRRIEDALASLHAFFHKANREYTRFNYIGEWHSHPSFEPIPSGPDDRSMHEIIDDPTVGANFVVLVVVKLDSAGALIGSAHTYLPNGVRAISDLVIEPHVTPKRRIRFI